MHSSESEEDTKTSTKANWLQRNSPVWAIYRNHYRPAFLLNPQAKADCFFKIDNPYATSVVEVRFAPLNGMAILEKVDPNFVFPIEREPAGQVYSQDKKTLENELVTRLGASSESDNRKEDDKAKVCDAKQTLICCAVCPGCTQTNCQCRCPDPEPKSLSTGGGRTGRRSNKRKAIQDDPPTKARETKRRRRMVEESVEEPPQNPVTVAMVPDPSWNPFVVLGSPVEQVTDAATPLDSNKNKTDQKNREM